MPRRMNPMRRRIKRNMVKCLICNDIVESKSRHDLKSCRCGETFVDGGLLYVRVGSKCWNSFEYMTEYYEDSGEDCSA